MPKPRGGDAAARSSRAQRTKREERPELTPENNVETGVRGTFPASDPLSATNVQGSRAVSPERMMRDDDARPEDAAGTTRLTARFPDHESAKLAIEALVREVPLDRHRIELKDATGGGEATVTVHVARGETERPRTMLEHHGGRLSESPQRGA